MSSRKVAEQATLPLDAPVGGVCMVCGEETDRLSKRHPPHGMECCWQCVTLPSTEVAVKWLRKIKRTVER